MANEKNENGKWFNNIARIIKTKKGGYVLVFGRPTDKDGKPKTEENPFPIVINEGDILPAKLKKVLLDKLVEEGRITEETAERIGAIEKFEIDLPPRETKKKKNKSDDDGVDF